MITYKEQTKIIDIMLAIYEENFDTKAEVLFYIYEQCPFLTELREVLLELSICPECGDKLHSMVIDKFSDEAWGRVILNDVTLGICEGCGSKYDPAEE